MLRLIFKFHLYQSRDNGSLSFTAFFHKLVKIKNLEQGSSVKWTDLVHIFKTQKCKI